MRTAALLSCAIAVACAAPRTVPPSEVPSAPVPLSEYFKVRRYGALSLDLTFSHDADEKYVLIADGTNDKVWIHDRMSGNVVGSIGDNGRMAGQFHWIDAIATDSKGNIYTGEVDTGKRVQKFILTNGDGKARPRPHE